MLLLVVINNVTLLLSILLYINVQKQHTSNRSVTIVDLEKEDLTNYYIDSSEKNAFIKFSDILYNTIKKYITQEHKEILFVCIGTDRSTGDSLGPLIGYKIRDMGYNNIFVMGDLDYPVHAKNLTEVCYKVKETFVNPFIIAVDACLGKMDHVGYITIGKGALKPGSGVNKDLEPIGDIHITGIVNFGGFMDFMILQNTRLSLVMRLADIMANGIKYASWKITMEMQGDCKTSVK